MTVRALFLAGVSALSLAASAHAQTVFPSPGAGGSGSGTVTSVACPSATITTTGNCNPLASNATSGDVITGAGTTIPQDSGTLLSSLATLSGTQTLTNKSISGSQINSGTIPAAQIPVATTGAVGGVKVDGTSIVISGSVISATTGGGGTVTSVTCGTGLTGGAITTIGTCAVGSLKSEYMWTVPSNVTVANGTTVLEINFPWSSGTITSVDYGTNGGTPSFSASVQIGGTPVTSCTALTVTSATNTNVACTGAQTLASGNTVTVVISSTSGTPDQSWVKVNFTHSVT